MLPVALLALAAAAALAGDDPVQFSRTIRAGSAEYRADFGRLAVPARQGEKGGAPLSLAFVRLRSTAEVPGPPLFFLPGIPNAATSARDWPEWEPFLALGDVVLLDLRGTGESRPRLSGGAAAWRAELCFGPRDEAVAHVTAACAEAARSWAAKGVDVADFDVVATARDVDALRSALGYERIRLLGHSAGTQLGLQIVRAFGARVEAFVSAGTAGPDHVQKPPSELDAALAEVARRAAADPSIGAEMPDLAATFARLVVDLDAEPLAVATQGAEGAPISVRLSGSGLAFLVALDLGDTSDLVVLPRLLASLERRETALVAWFLAKRLRQLSELPVLLFAQRGASGATEARAARIAREAETSPFGRARTFFWPETCAPLGVRDLGDAFRAPVASDVRVLFLSGALDANTPPGQAEEVRRGFPRSTHVVFESFGHERVLRDPAALERALAFFAGDALRDERVPGPPLTFAPLRGAADGYEHPALEAERTARPPR